MHSANIMFFKILVIIFTFVPYVVLGQIIKQKSLPQRQKARTAQFPSAEESMILF
jgi:hypothetical protein